MSTLKTVVVAASLLGGATSLAMAQNNNGMPPSSYTGPGAYQSYKSENFRAPANTNTTNNNTSQPSARCRLLAQQGRPLPAGCR